MPPRILNPDNPGVLDQAVRAIQSAEAVAVPTETVYGLAANAYSDAGVGQIYQIKGRPQFNPLIVHVADPDDADRLVDLSPEARTLIKAFWPGPLTLVAPLKLGHGISPIVLAGNATLAIRCPDAPVIQALIRQSGAPLAAPSANSSGSLSPTTADHVASSLAEWDGLVLDGGPCRVGLESTIVDVSRRSAVLLRPGGVSVEALEALVGPLESELLSDQPKAPGQLKSHYAPRASLRLNVTHPEPDEAYLAFGPFDGDHHKVVNLSPGGDLVEAATNLFAALNALDNDSERIAVGPIPTDGLGAAINDRLLRAATKKS